MILILSRAHMAVIFHPHPSNICSPYYLLYCFSVNSLLLLLRRISFKSSPPRHFAFQKCISTFIYIELRLLLQSFIGSAHSLTTDEVENDFAKLMDCSSTSVNSYHEGRSKDTLYKTKTPQAHQYHVPGDTVSAGLSGKLILWLVTFMYLTRLQISVSFFCSVSRCLCPLNYRDTG